jgi:hypothetical protein
MIFARNNLQSEFFNEERAVPASERPVFPQSCSLRAFLRLRLRASASFTRFLSPGFR